MGATPRSYGDHAEWIKGEYSSLPPSYLYENSCGFLSGQSARRVWILDGFKGSWDTDIILGAVGRYHDTTTLPGRLAFFEGSVLIMV